METSPGTRSVHGQVERVIRQACSAGANRVLLDLNFNHTELGAVKDRGKNVEDKGKI